MATPLTTAEIEQQVVPKYKNYYVAFGQLLDAIYLLKERESTGKNISALSKGLLLPKDFTFTDTTAIFGLVEQQPEVRFVSLLQHEVSKLNHFTALEVKTILSSLRQLARKLDRVIDGVDVTDRVRQVFPSAIDEIDVGLSIEDKLLLIYERLVSVSEEILVLEHYIKLNIHIFGMIVDEFDKSFSDRPPIGVWFIPRLDSESFSKTPLSDICSIVAKLLSRCPLPASTSTGATKMFSVCGNQSIRAKLMVAGLTPIQRPTGIPEKVWSLTKSLPARVEDIFPETLRCASEMIRIIFSDGQVKSVTFAPSEDTKFEVAFSNGTTESYNRQEIESMEFVVQEVVVVSFDLTKYSSACLLDNIRIKNCLFDTRSFLLEFPSLEFGFVGNEGTPSRRSSVASSGGNVSLSNSSGWTPVEASILETSSDMIQSRLSSLLTPLPDIFSLDHIPFMDRSTGSTTPEPFTPYVPLSSPIEFHHPHPVLPFSPKSTSPKQSSLIPPRLIYPKNFMANERSCLAWISAISVQAGIGLALLGKSGVSLVGAIICLTALVFLWWSIYVFVQRYRQIKNPKEEQAHWFYSMSLPTAFGVSQMAILTIQSLVMLWW
jgi:hypothetical protein